jgi:4-amino-4-deoxy-L-arabinose transferase-like glycosyltransferase
MRPTSLTSFILRDKQNKLYLLALPMAIIEMVIFKILYPFPDFISDSYSYIATNLYHMKVNLWPIGYSIFIGILHAISPSQYLLIFCQYIILVLALLYFFYTILFLYTPNKTSTRLLFAFLFLNPLFIYLANCVLSDTLFCAISIVIFTQYLWMTYKPNLSLLIISGLLIGIAFTIRYTAIYYPIFGIIGLLITKFEWYKKIAGILLPWMLIIPFILYTQQKTKEVTGTAEFSVFGGWQIANNALYMYGDINVDNSQVPQRAQQLDLLSKKYFKEISPSEEDLASVPGTYFIKVPDAILKPYLFSHTEFNSDTSQFRAWGQVSPIYNEYGKYLIKKYPIAFIRSFIWLNTKNYFFPYLEKFGNYNLEKEEVGHLVSTWFQMKDSHVFKRPSSKWQQLFYGIFPMLFLVLNIYFIARFIQYFVINKSRPANKMVTNLFILSLAFLIINFGFSVFASPIVLRYQIVPMILLCLLSIYINELLLPYDNATSKDS